MDQLLELSENTIIEVLDSLNVPPILSQNITIAAGRLPEISIRDVSIILSPESESFLLNYPYCFKFENVHSRSISVESINPENIDSGTRRLIEITNSKIANVYLTGSRDVVLEVSEMGIPYSLSIGSQIRGLYLKGTNHVKNLHITGDEDREDEMPMMTSRIEGNENFLKIDTFEINHVGINLVLSGCEIGKIFYQSKLVSRVLVRESTSIRECMVRVFSGRLVLHSSTIVHLQLLEMSNTTSVLFQSSSIHNLLVDSKLNEFPSFVIRNCQVSNLLLISGRVHNLEIESSLVGVFYARAKSFFFDDLYVYGDAKHKTHVNKLIFGDGILSSGATSQKSIIKLENFSVTGIAFKSIVNRADFFISKIRYDERASLKLEEGTPLIDVTMYRGLYLAELDFEEKLLLHDADLGKINFISCDFSKLEMSIVGSKINEIYVAGTEWPMVIGGQTQFGHYQLKKVFDNQGDTIRSTAYAARELDSHYQSVKNYLLREKVERSLLLEFIVLWLNRTSNYYGTNWGRSFVAIFLFSGWLFWWYCWSVGYAPTIDWNRDNWNSFQEVFPYFFEFILPTHRQDFMSGSLPIIPNGYSRFWDFLGKIGNSYLIYQFVQSFRKYGKR